MVANSAFVEQKRTLWGLFDRMGGGVLELMFDRLE